MRWLVAVWFAAALASLTHAALTVKGTGARSGALGSGPCQCKDGCECGVTYTTSTTTTVTTTTTSTT